MGGGTETLALQYPMTGLWKHVQTSWGLYPAIQFTVAAQTSSEIYREVHELSCTLISPQGMSKES